MLLYLVFILFLPTTLCCSFSPLSVSKLNECLVVGQNVNCKLEADVLLSLPIVAGNCFNFTITPNSSLAQLYPDRVISLQFEVVSVDVLYSLQNGYGTYSHWQPFEELKYACTYGSDVSCDAAIDPFDNYCSQYSGLPRTAFKYEGCPYLTECVVGTVHCGCMYHRYDGDYCRIFDVGGYVMDFSFRVAFQFGDYVEKQSLTVRSDSFSMKFNFMGGLFPVDVELIGEFNVPDNGLAPTRSLLICGSGCYSVGNFNTLGSYSLDSFGWVQFVQGVAKFSHSDYVLRNYAVGAGAICDSVDGNLVRYGLSFDNELIFQNLLEKQLNQAFTIARCDQTSADSEILHLKAKSPINGLFNIKMQSTKAIKFIESTAQVKLAKCEANSICENSDININMIGINSGDRGLGIVYVNNDTAPSVWFPIGAFNVSIGYVTTETEFKVCTYTDVLSCVECPLICVHEVDPDAETTSNGGTVQGSDMPQFDWYHILIFVATGVIFLAVIACLINVCRRQNLVAYAPVRI